MEEITINKALEEKCSDNNRGAICYAKSENEMYAYRPSDLCGKNAFEIYKSYSKNPDKSIWRSLHKGTIFIIVALGIILISGLTLWMSLTYGFGTLTIISFIILLIAIIVLATGINLYTGGTLVGGIVVAEYSIPGVNYENINKCMENIDQYANAYISSTANSESLKSKHVSTLKNPKINKYQNTSLGMMDVAFYDEGKGSWNPKWSYEYEIKSGDQKGTQKTEKFNGDEYKLLADYKASRDSAIKAKEASQRTQIYTSAARMVQSGLRR